MTLIELVMLSASCAITVTPPAACVEDRTTPPTAVTLAPTFTGTAVDVIISAEAALVWDAATGEILYAKNADRRRPIASLTKLLSVLVLKDVLNPATIIPIPAEVSVAGRSGANIRLPIGEHTSVAELLAAALIPSANDAMVALAVTAFGSEEQFVQAANSYARTQGLRDTLVANATGLSGGQQHSTARDVKRLLTAVYQDPNLRPLLAQEEGVLTTIEGTRRPYKTTNKLLGTYLPITAAKTGYTVEAGQNLAILTSGRAGQQIGAVILGSDERFQDMKILIEWIWRNYTWPGN